MEAAHVQRLGKEHRAERAGPDQPNSDGSICCRTLAKQAMKTHGSIPSLSSMYILFS
jgi:hypothetical protein